MGEVHRARDTRLERDVDFGSSDYMVMELVPGPTLDTKEGTAPVDDDMPPVIVDCDTTALYSLDWDAR